MLTVIAFIFFFGIVVLIEHFWKKRLQGDKKTQISETPGRKVDAWGRWTISGTGIITMILVFSMDSMKAIKIFFIGYFIVLYGFQAFLEWKYLKGSKEFIATLAALAFGVAFIFIIESIFAL